MFRFAREKEFSKSGSRNKIYETVEMNPITVWSVFECYQFN